MKEIDMLLLILYMFFVKKKIQIQLIVINIIFLSNNNPIFIYHIKE
jgi:hypothetical protein